MFRSSLSMVIAAVFLAASACSSMQSPGDGAGTGGSEGGLGGSGVGGTLGRGGTSGSGGGDSDAGPTTDAAFCCPPDPTMSGCMHLGGASPTGACYLTCDFWCTNNWRIQPDSDGCPTWRYDFAPCDLFDAGDARRD